MISEHPVFISPENKEQVIWRYLDFTKLVSLLESSELFFTRADKFEDQFEGSLPKPLVYGRNIWVKNMVEQGKLSQEYLDFNILSDSTKNAKIEKVINCWHMNDYESAAMWKLYLKSNEGIAIKSTYSRLYSALSSSEFDINIGKVKYIDYENDIFPLDNGFYPFVHKRKSFEHEQELRALIWLKSAHNNKLIENIDVLYGINIEVDLNKLIESIYVSPNSPKWIYDLIVSIIKRYKLNKNVYQSKINESPIY